MTPVYFPFTYVPDEVAAATSLFFSNIICYHNGSDIPPRMHRSADTLQITYRNPFPDTPDRFDDLYNAYRDWAANHQGSDLAFFKSTDMQSIPFFDDTTAPHRIRDAIKAYRRSEKTYVSSGLLRARIFLRLAAAFDQQQEELTTGFRSITAKEQQMFTRLIGEDAEEFEQFAVGKEAVLSDYGSHMTSERIGAWTCLFLNDPSPPAFFLTSSPAIAAHVFENILVDTETAGIVPMVARKAVTALSLTPDIPPEQLQEQRKIAATAISDTMAAPPSDKGLDIVTQLTDTSNNLNHITLELYKFSGISPNVLFKPFGRLFDTDGNPAQCNDNMQDTLIGVIRVP